MEASKRMSEESRAGARDVPRQATVQFVGAAFASLSGRLPPGILAARTARVLRKPFFID